MTNRKNYLEISSMIAKMMNESRLAFKTFEISDLDGIATGITGGLKVSDETLNPEILEDALRDQGFLVYPEIIDALDSMDRDEESTVRVFRAGSIAGNLLNAVKHPNMSTDAHLAGLLCTLRRKREDSFESDEL